MRERPILFSATMVRAILEGRKTQTRRVVKPQPRTRADIGHHGLGMPFIRHPDPLRRNVACPYGLPGDRLWVKEAWGPCDGGFCYRADEPDGSTAKPDDGRWHPSIHMFRKASRIDLEVTNVRVERLQSCSEADALAEGVQPASPGACVIAYQRLWEAINGPGSWDADPWVWVVDFRRVRP